MEISKSEPNDLVRCFCDQNNFQNVSDNDLLELKESLYHLGKALYLYHLQKNGGENGR